MIIFSIAPKPDKKLIINTAKKILENGSKKSFWNLEKGNFRNRIKFNNLISHND